MATSEIPDYAKGPEVTDASLRYWQSRSGHERFARVFELMFEPYYAEHANGPPPRLEPIVQVFRRTPAGDVLVHYIDESNWR